MKKYIYLFFAALLAVACVEPLQPYLGPIINEPEDGAPVTVEFSLPPVTKGAMAHNPTISTIHVAVFNQAGVLKQYEKATLTDDASNNVLDGISNNNPKYSVEINMSATKRILHFIGDSPVQTFDELVALAGTSGEDAVLNALTTAAGNVAYWQRIELDKIDAYVYDGVSYSPPGSTTPYTGSSYSYQYQGQTITVNEGDFIKRDGSKVLDGTGYFASNYVAGRLANIPLIRNFAEITVSRDENGSNFIPVKYALMNVPKKGYVAPFDTKKGVFATAYTYTYPAEGDPVFNESLSYSTISGSGYPGSLAGIIDPSVPRSFITLTGDDDLAKKAYMYERTIPNIQQPATCVLIAGKYDADGDNVYDDDDGAKRDTDGYTWFKFEITDTKGGYFPIYRGLSYDIKIGQISGTSGYASAEDAAAADAIGDISGSPTTATLEQISDGKGTTLWVEYVDYVATQPETKTIYYTMYYQSGSSITYYDVDLTVNHPDESYKAITANVVIDNNSYGYGTTNSGTPDDTKTWKKATVTLGTAGQSVTNTLHSILHVEGTSHENKPLYREVHYRVMSTQEFENGNNKLKATPLEDEEANRTTTLTIYLPADLGYSMFPLTLKIEAEDSNFTTADGLPVESGPSMFDSNKNTFYFLKTIEYDDYYNAETGAYTYVFKAKFKTTRNGTTAVKRTNATTFAVQDKIKTGRTTPYFNLATCNVTVGGPVFRLVGDSPVSVAADVEEVTMKIKNTSGGTWTLTKGEGVISVSPESGSTVDGEITVTIPANTDENNAKTYTVTAKLDAEHAALVEGYEDLTFTINQAKKSTKYYTINLNAGTYGWVSSNVNPDSNTYYSYQSNNAGHDNTIATMSVTVVGYTEFKIRIRNNAEAYYDYVIVSQIGATPLTTSNWSTNNSKYYSYYNTTEPNLNNYSEVIFTTADGLTADNTAHTFYIQFRKDSGWEDGNDCAYVLISKGDYYFIANPS